MVDPGRLWSAPRRRRYLLWGLLAGVFLLVNVYRLSTAVLAEDLMAAFEATGTELGTLHAVFFWIYALMQIPTGVLADRIGPRRTAAVGGATMSVGGIAFALAGGYPLALLGRGLIGLGGSVIFVCTLRFCASWFRTEEYATMSGLTFAVAGVGGVLATTPLAVVSQEAGWRPTLAVLGVIGLALAGAVFALVRDSPGRAGLERIRESPSQATVSTAAVRGHLVSVLRDPWTWAVSVLLFCTAGVNLTLFGLWGVPYVSQTYDVSVTTASVFALLGGVGLMVGPPAIGWLSDRLEARTPFLVAGGVAYVLALATIAILGDPPLVVVGTVFFVTGILIGAFVLSYTIVSERHPTEASGVATGTVNGAGFLGAAVIPTLMGWALDAYWTGEVVAGARVYTATGYRVAFGIATVSGLIALVAALWLHRAAGRPD